MSALDHLFENIALGSIPAHKVYEDELVCAFLDINPLSPGHTLVIPRKRSARVDEMPDEIAAAVGRVLPKICRAVMHATGAQAYNVLSNNGSSAGQVVPHVHFHIIPKYEDGSGLPHHWPAKSLDHQEAVRLREAIKAEIAG